MLWFIILTGLIYHIILHLTPVFYGIDIIKANAEGITPVSMVLTFGFSFCIPVFAVLNVQYTISKTGKILNIILSSLAMLVNTGHLSEIFITRVKQAEQLFVLIPLFLISVLLLRDSVKWLKNGY